MSDTRNSGASGFSRRDMMKFAAAGFVAPIAFGRAGAAGRTGGVGQAGQAINAVRRRGHMHAHVTRPVHPIAKFVDRLPIPDVLRPTGINNGVPQYSVGMTQFKQRLHRALPPTTLWGYDGTYPGPTFDVRRGQPIDVTWHNRLPAQHVLEYGYDTSIHGADSGEPHSRTVVHLHGIKVMPESDGYPEAWFTNGFDKTGPAFANRTYHYPNDQQATGLWYHDHSLGITRLNVYTGLSGFYFIRDAEEDGLNLPKGAYEIPLLIQDRSLNLDASLLYPTVTDGTHNVWVPECFGNMAVVNGKIWPYLDVEPRKYRFRMLNGSNARFYHLSVVDETGNPGPTFNQIGTDGGLLPAPVELADVLMAPAERFDIVIDFSQFAGQKLVLKNDAPVPFPGGGEVDLPEIMQFRVMARTLKLDNSSLPGRLVSMSMIDPSTAARKRNIMLSEADRATDGFPIEGLLGGSPLNTSTITGGLHWHDAVTEDPKAGSTEIWNFVNITTDAHPMHVHLVQFQVLERRTFDLPEYLATGKVTFTGAPIAPEPNERPAWKDTVKAFSGLDDNGNVTGLVTRVIAKFDPPSGAPMTPGQRLRYVLHCHILEHEDEDMMRPYDVVI
jgi:spore coat protein A, manganese oxidase